MTSTNDGKDVKSNQTSGPKGKTYYIELYKSLEAGLSSDCELGERTQHLCEAWRRIHSLCQHSAPSTHPHLLSWLQRHTARTVLQTEWQSPKSKDQHKRLEEAINAFIKECESRSGSSREAGPPPWETQLVARGEWFKRILANPWGHPVLRILLDPRGEPPSDEEVLEWLKEERGVMFVTRLRQLAASKCDDLALSLSSAVMDRVRACVEVPPDTDTEPADVKDQPKVEKKPTFEDILKTEAGFTVDVWELLTDMEFVLLHKGDKRSRCIELAKQTPLRNGYQLVERLQSRLETSPREKKLWKNAKEVATLIAQVIITRCMVVPVCSGASRTALYCCARSLVRVLGARLPPAARALAAPAATARHLHTLAAAVDAQSKEDLKPFVCELYVRAITAGMNELERLKIKTEKEAEARSTEQTLASWFTQLGALLSASERLRCECVLTAFSVHPTPAMFERIKVAPPLPPRALDVHETKEEPNSEFGSWASDSRGQTNFVKTSETLNLKHTQHQANVLSTAIFSEGEALGISPELCQDIAVLLSGPRLKTLSWDTDRELLLENCRAYMERTNYGTRAVTTELKYLNLDPSQFQHLPIEEDDDTDIYYGIEKGYEHLVEEYQEPEEIWKDAEDLERTESAYSTDVEPDYPVVRPKKSQKKTRKIHSSEEESDPLSLVPETKRIEKKKERPHSKERSKEPKEPKKTKSKKPKDPLDIKDPTTEKTKEHKKKEKKERKEKKEKKERKRKEKPEPSVAKTSSSLSNLIGMKVTKVLHKIPDPAVTPSISDSDYDSQGKCSLNSAISTANETDVLFDGLFSMDELKSPEKSPDKTVVVRNIELHSANAAVVSSPIPPTVINHNDTQSQKDAIISPMQKTTKSRINSPIDCYPLAQGKMTTVTDEVKKSISKLIHFRRQKTLSESEQRVPLQPNIVHTYSYTQGNESPVITPMQTPIPIKNRQKPVNVSDGHKTPQVPGPSQWSPKPLNVTDNPKVYINKTQSDQLTELKNEVNNLLCSKTFGIARPVIQYGPKTNNSLLNNSQTSNIRHPIKSVQDNMYRMQPLPIKSSVNTELKPSASRPTASNRPKSLDTANQQNFHAFLKELQESINAGAGKDTSKNVTIKKEIKPISRVSSVVPTAKADPKTSPHCAKQYQKKSENLLNTFSRLSYLHKNKMENIKSKQVVDAVIEYQCRTLQKRPQISELNRSICEQKDAKARYLQHKSLSLSSGADKAAYHASDNPQSLLKKSENVKYASTARENPLIANILTSPTKSAARTENQCKNDQMGRSQDGSSTPNKFSSLTERDQQDLVLLLRQQSKLNRPVQKGENVKERVQPPQTITGNMLPSNYSVPCTSQSNKNKILDAPRAVSSNVNVKQYSEYNSKTNITNPSPSIKPPNFNQNDVRTSQAKPLNMVKTELNCTKTVEEKIRKIERFNDNDTKNNKHKSASISKSNSEKESTDWEKVMDAILSHKTPSRGPNALDMALNKDVYNKESESLRNQRIVRPNSTGDTLKTTNMKGQSNAVPTQNMNKPNMLSSSKSESVIKTNINKNKIVSKHPAKVNQKLLTNTTTVLHANPNLSRPVQCETPKRHIQTEKKPSHVMKDQIDVLKKIPNKHHEKQFTCSYYKEDDPFISGIPNSDYDLLEELMDDDLRQEIGELSSDEDSYRTMQGLKDKTYSINKPMTPMIHEEKRLNPTVINTIPTLKNPVPKTRCDISKISFDPSVQSQQSLAITNAKSVIKNAEYKNDESTRAQPTNAVNQMVKSDITPPMKSNNQSINANVNAIRTVDQSNTPASAAPCQATIKNVLLIGSDIVYQPCPVGTPIRAASVTQNTYVAFNNQPNMAIYQTTQFAAPIVNPLIIGNAITVPITTIPVKIQQANVNNHCEANTTTPKSKKEVRNEADQDKTVKNDVKDIKLKTNTVEKHNDDTLKPEKEKLEINSNKNCERKVLSEVQEKQNLQSTDFSDKVEPKMTRSQSRLSFDRDMKNEVLKDQERLRNKRLAILNRNICHRSDNKVIPLTYAPLNTVKVNSNVIQDDKKIEKANTTSDDRSDNKTYSVKLESLLNTKIRTLEESLEANTVGKTDKTDSNTNCKENKDSSCRRILLRSSNKVDKINAERINTIPVPRKTKVRILLRSSNKVDKINAEGINTNPVPRKTKVRLKSTCPENVNKTVQNGTDEVKNTKFIVIKKRKSKKTVNNKIKKVANKTKASKIQPKRNVKAKTTGHSKTEQKPQELEICTEIPDLMDLEEQIIISKIPKISPSARSLSPLKDIPNVDKIQENCDEDSTMDDLNNDYCSSPSILDKDDTLTQLLSSESIDSHKIETDVISQKEISKYNNFELNKDDETHSKVNETVDIAANSVSNENNNSDQITTSNVIDEIESYVKRLEQQKNGIAATVGNERLQTECREIIFSSRGVDDISSSQPEEQGKKVVEPVKAVNTNTTEVGKTVASQEKTATDDLEVICLDEDGDEEPNFNKNEEPIKKRNVLKPDINTCSQRKSQNRLKDGIPQSIKDAIVIEDLPHLNTGDPLKKCVRIKLPSGRVFKATVHGQMNIDTNALFADPALKAVLLSNVCKRNKYTLNIKQTSTSSKTRPDKIIQSQIQEIHLANPMPIAPCGIVETIDLSSDSDEDNACQYFSTEYGKYKVPTMKRKLFGDHQKSLAKKCVVQIKRHNLQMYLNPKEDEDQVETSVQSSEEITPTIPSTSLETMNSVKELTIEPAVEVITVSVVEPAHQHVIEPEVQPDVQPVVEPIVQHNIQPVAQPAIRPDIQPDSQLAILPDIKPIVQPAIKPVVQSVIKHVTLPNKTAAQHCVQSVVNFDDQQVQRIDRTPKVIEPITTLNEPEIIEIDDSSNDESDINKLESTESNDENQVTDLEPLNEGVTHSIIVKDKINEPKSLDHIIESIPVVGKINEFKNLLFKDLGIEDLAEDSTHSDEVLLSLAEGPLLADTEAASNDSSPLIPGTPTKCVLKSTECFVKLTKCDDLVRKYENLKLLKKCFIKLVRCDEYDQSCIEPSTDADQNNTDDIIKESSFEECASNIAPLSRCGSFSILSDFDLCDTQQTVEEIPRSNSPVMEAYETIVSLINGDMKTIEKVRNENLTCETEWFMTKPKFCLQHKIVQIQDQWSNRRCNTANTNSSTKHTESINSVNVKPLKSLVLNFFHNHSILGQLKYVGLKATRNVQRLSASLKRKSLDVIETDCKISKTSENSRQKQYDDIFTRDNSKVNVKTSEFINNTSDVCETLLAKCDIVGDKMIEVSEVNMESQVIENDINSVASIPNVKISSDDIQAKFTTNTDVEIKLQESKSENFMVDVKTVIPPHAEKISENVSSSTLYESDSNQFYVKIDKTQFESDADTQPDVTEMAADNEAISGLEVKNICEDNEISELKDANKENIGKADDPKPEIVDNISKENIYEDSIMTHVETNLEAGNICEKRNENINKDSAIPSQVPILNVETTAETELVNTYTNADTELKITEAYLDNIFEGIDKIPKDTDSDVEVICEEHLENIYDDVDLNLEKELQSSADEHNEYTSEESDIKPEDKKLAIGNSEGADKVPMDAEIICEQNNENITENVDTKLDTAEPLMETIYKSAREIICLKNCGNTSVVVSKMIENVYEKESENAPKHDGIQSSGILPEVTDSAIEIICEESSENVCKEVNAVPEKIELYEDKSFEEQRENIPYDASKEFELADPITEMACERNSENVDETPGEEEMTTESASEEQKINISNEAIETPQNICDGNSAVVSVTPGKEELDINTTCGELVENISEDVSTKLEEGKLAEENSCEDADKITEITDMDVTITCQERCENICESEVETTFIKAEMAGESMSKDCGLIAEETEPVIGNVCMDFHETPAETDSDVEIICEESTVNFCKNVDTSLEKAGQLAQNICDKQSENIFKQNNMVAEIATMVEDVVEKPTLPTVTDFDIEVICEEVSESIVMDDDKLSEVTDIVKDKLCDEPSEQTCAEDDETRKANFDIVVNCEEHSENIGKDVNIPEETNLYKENESEDSVTVLKESLIESISQQEHNGFFYEEDCKSETRPEPEDIMKAEVNLNRNEENKPEIREIVLNINLDRKLIVDTYNKLVGVDNREHVNNVEKRKGKSWNKKDSSIHINKSDQETDEKKDKVDDIVHMRSDEIPNENLATIILANATEPMLQTNTELSKTESQEYEVIQNQDSMIINDNDEQCGLVLSVIECEGEKLGTCYLFPVNTVISGSSEDANPSTEEVIQISHKCRSEELDIKLKIPKITYSKKSTKENVADYLSRDRKNKKGIKRKAEMNDIKINEKKYRKGKNIDYPKITIATVEESAYGKEFKRLLDYCSTVKFSYSRPFHKEYIDVQEALKSWPITGICHVGEPDTEKDKTLFTEIEGAVKTLHDPTKQTLAEEIVAEHNESDYSTCDIMETNFNKGFGEGSGRVKQNLEDGCGIKFSAATLSDVKQTQPLLLSEHNGHCNRVHNQINVINKHEIDKLHRSIKCIQLKDKVRSSFKKTMSDLSYDWIKQQEKDISNCNGLFDSDFPHGLNSLEFIQPAPVEAIIQVVQVGQLPVSAAAQNPVTCDPRVTQVSNASPSQCSEENSPSDDPQSVIKTEYTELTTADLSMPLAQEYVQHIQSMPVAHHDNMSYPMGSHNYNLDDDIKPEIKIEMEETPEIKEEINDNYDNSDYPPLFEKNMMNNVDYSYETNSSQMAPDTNTNMSMMYNYTEKPPEPFPHLKHPQQEQLLQHQLQQQHEQQLQEQQQQEQYQQEQYQQEQYQQEQYQQEQYQQEQYQQEQYQKQQKQLQQQLEQEQYQQQQKQLQQQLEQEQQQQKHLQEQLEQEQQLQQEQYEEQQRLLQQQQIEQQQQKLQQLHEQQLQEQQLKQQRLQEKQLKKQQLQEQQLKQQQLKQQQLHARQLKIQQLQEQQLKQQKLQQELKQQQQKRLERKQLQQQQQELKHQQHLQELKKQQQHIQELKQQKKQLQDLKKQELNQQQELKQQQLQELKQQQQELEQQQLNQQKQQQKQQEQQQNNSQDKTDQIAHAMNAAGISGATDNISDNRAQALVNMLSQKIRQGSVVTSQATSNNYQKTTSINAMALQQALAQILPPPLNQTNTTENNQQTSPQVLHIVQGKSSGNHQQITLVDGQQSVINTPNATPVLHIVQNKTTSPGPTSNGTPASQNNTFSGLSLVDTGLQQGNQLLHIVNTGNQKNASTGQLLRKVNLLTNLANVQGGNEQKMVQFLCKSADGKPIQLNGPHQRSMVLRLQPVETPNLQPTQSKQMDSQDLSPTHSSANNISSKEAAEIKSRSVYEENYAKFIQGSSPKATVPEKGTSLPKFNQAFGKQVYQDGVQKNEMSNNNSHMSPNGENPDCQPNDNAINLEHISQIGSPPLLLRKPQTSQAQPNLVQQLKQTISPMNIHGGVIYTRQIPVNIGGGQTINLITVPSSDLIDESNPKQQGEIEPSIIKIVPQTQTNSNSDATEENNAHAGSSTNENSHTPQPQPVLTQMRIKLPMLSKAPQMVSGGRVVRPSFFQIQRNVIGGANQPVYQQLVLTAAPPLGQQTIKLPQAQGGSSSSSSSRSSRPVKTPSESQSSTESMSSSTLEQLREFDLVLEQVKERSTVQPNATSKSALSKKHTPSTDTTDGPASTSSAAAPAEPSQSQPAPHKQHQVLYSIGNTQPLNVAYVNRKSSAPTPTTSTFVRSPDSSGIVDSSPTSSTSAQIPHTVTSDSSKTEPPVQAKPSKSSKSKTRSKAPYIPPNSLKLNTVHSKTSSQKPAEDEQTTQRILYILAEYKEQVENSPDKDKPAPRRRTNLPSNPGSSKRKKSSSSCRRGRDMSPIHGEDTCRTMGSEDSSCGTSQGDCNDSCLDSHSPQDSPRKVVRKLTFEHETPAPQPRPQPQRNVIVADGQTITVARGTAGKPSTAVLMPANYILPVSMIKGGQQIAIVTNRGPKLLTVGGGEGGATNALLLQRLIGPAGLKPVLARPGVRHVRLPTAALHNLQAFNLATATTVQPPDSTASPAPAPTPPELVETRANSSPWRDREAQKVKPKRGSSPEDTEPWHLPASADPHDYSYEEVVRTDNMDRTVLDPIPDRYSPDMEAQRIFDKMFDVDSKKSYMVGSHDDSPRCGYDIDASDCDDKSYHQVVQKKDGSHHRQHRLTHVSAAALRHKYAILEHELRLQKSLSEECEDLGVDSPSASELFPEAELLFAASPAHDHTQDHGHHSHTPQPLLHQSGIPQPDLDDQIATDQLLPRSDMHDDRSDLGVGLEDVGIVTVSEDGMQATIALDQEEFARSHPNTTFHSSEPTDEGEVQPFTISGLKGRHITSTIFHASRAPGTVLMTAPQTTVISQATPETSGGHNPIKYADIDNMINSLPGPTHGNNMNLSSVLVKDDRLTRFDSILNDSRELHLSNTASAIVHATGNNTTQVIRRVCYGNKREHSSRFLMDEHDGLTDSKMMAEDSRDFGDGDDDRSTPERTELFWESNSTSERESRRPLDFSSDSDKFCKSPSFEENNSTDSSGIGTHMRLDSVIKDARGIERRGSADGSSADDAHAPPLRTYPAKRLHHAHHAQHVHHAPHAPHAPHVHEAPRSLSGKTRAGERAPHCADGRRRASARGVVKRGCHCCNGEPAPPRPKKPRQRKPNIDFTTN